MKRILIIGATSAIAAECARLWAAKGAAFMLAGRNADKLAAVADDLRVRGAAQLHTFQLDADDVSRHAALLAATQQLGDIDIALIAHGVLPDQAACEADPALVVAQFTTNATSQLALLTALATVFEKQQHGALAVITSVAGDRGRPTNYAYGSAKAAVSAFCEGLRARLFKSHVSVTDIRPGFIATPMTAHLQLPSALVAQPADIAPRIVAAIERGTDVVYTPAFWWLILFVVRYLPGFIFKRMKL